MNHEEFPKLPMQWREHGYEIDEKLGEGAYGKVYRLVKNKGTDQEEYSALKIISKELTKKYVRNEYKGDWTVARKEFTQWFNRLAGEISMLETFMDEPHIVQIKGSCLEKMPEENYWTAYIQMEYLTELMEYIDSGEQHGKSTDTVWESQMGPEEVIRLGIEMCEALEVCHDYHILHRDIKPDNIMVAEDGSFKLGDFGVAREQVDGSMTVIGTYDYMAPEIMMTSNYDESADLYSLGMVLYYLSNDRKLPFSEIRDMHERAGVRAQWTKPLPEPQKAFEPMRRVILKACAHNPAERYQSAREMKMALRRAALCPYGFCPECGHKLLKKKGPYGEFLGCSEFRKNQPDSCRYSAGIEERLKDLNN